MKSEFDGQYINNDKNEQGQLFISSVWNKQYNNIQYNITEYQQRFNEDPCNCSLVSLFKKHLSVFKLLIGQCCITKKLRAKVDSDTNACFCFIMRFFSHHPSCQKKLVVSVPHRHLKRRHRLPLCCILLIFCASYVNKFLVWRKPMQFE